MKIDIIIHDQSPLPLWHSPHTKVSTNVRVGAQIYGNSSVVTDMRQAKNDMPPILAKELEILECVKKHIIAIQEKILGDA